MENIFAELPRISAALFTRPWLIIPEVHGLLVGQLQAALVNRGSGTPSAFGGRRRGGGEKAEGEVNSVTAFHKQSRLGVITVRGVIGKGLSQFDMDCGGVCLDQVEQGLDGLRGLKPVAVAMHFDTPGGTVTGVEECAAAVEEFSANVAPIHGYTDTLCASAGTWLSASCATMHAAPSATLGSIGVYCPLFDFSEAYKKEGIGVEMVSTGPLKGAGFRGVPVSEDQRAALRSSVDRIGADFFRHMGARRKMINPAVHFTGGTWHAKEPNAAALHDGLIRNRSEHLSVLMGIYR